jgi:hypothetical protein
MQIFVYIWVYRIAELCNCRWSHKCWRLGDRGRAREENWKKKKICKSRHKFWDDILASETSILSILGSQNIRGAIHFGMLFTKIVEGASSEWAVPHKPWKHLETRCLTRRKISETSVDHIDMTCYSWSPALVSRLLSISLNVKYLHSASIPVGHKCMPSHIRLRFNLQLYLAIRMCGQFQALAPDNSELLLLDSLHLMESPRARPLITSQDPWHTCTLTFGRREKCWRDNSFVGPVIHRLSYLILSNYYDFFNY